MNARDRRLMLLFFDFSGMDPDQIERGVDSAKKFVQTKMLPADMIALVSLSTNMRVDLDFTDDKAKVLAGLSAYTSSEGQGFDAGTEGSAEGGAETGGAFTTTIPTTTRSPPTGNCWRCNRSCRRSEKSHKRNRSFISAMGSRSRAPKSVGVARRNCRCHKNNVSIYPLDVRGLQALPPVGACNASLHGQTAYNGSAVFNDLNSNAGSQETLSDAGGRYRRQSVF